MRILLKAETPFELKNDEEMLDLSTANKRTILNEDQIKFRPRVPVPSLT
jgi:hypothetical protein